MPGQRGQQHQHESGECQICARQRREAAQARHRVPGRSAGPHGEVRQLTASNIARRDSFAESIPDASRVAEAPSGFEPAGPEPEDPITLPRGQNPLNLPWR